MLIDPQGTAGTAEILLVDDNPTDVFFIQGVLKHSRRPVRVGVVPDAENALARLRHEGQYLHAVDPNLVLIDLNLPGKNGWAVLTEIKNNPRLRHIPAVVVTGSGTIEDVYHSKQLRADYYLVKPMKITEFPMLLKTVDWLLEGVYRPR